MKDASFLFQLVHSLSQNEKRLFSLLAKTASEKEPRYLILFRHIAAQKKDDPVRLKNEFGAKHIEQLKQQLTKKILQALRMLYDEQGPQRQVCLHLFNHQLLADRGLLQPAGRELRRAMTVAAAAEVPQLVPLVRQYEKRHLRHADAGSFLPFGSEKKPGLTCLEIGNEEAYDDLLLQAGRYNESLEATRDKEELKALERFRRQALLSDERRALTTRARMLRSFINGLIAYLRSDFESCEAAMGKTVAVFSANPSLRQQEEELFIRALANRALALFRLGRLPAFSRAMGQLQQYTPSNAGRMHYRDELFSVLQLMQLNRQKRYAEAVSLIESRPEFFSLQERTVTVTQQQTYLLFETAAAWSGAGQLNKATRLISDFIRDRGRGMKKDAYLMSRIFYLLLRFDQRDPDLIESELRSVRRLLKNENKLFLFERKVLRFVNSMMTQNEPKMIRAHFLRLRSDLLALKKIPHERNAFLYYDFSVWVEKYLAA